MSSKGFYFSSKIEKIRVTGTLTSESINFVCIVLLVRNNSNTSFVRGKYDYVLVVS